MDLSREAPPTSLFNQNQIRRANSMSSQAKYFADTLERRGGHLWSAVVRAYEALCEISNSVGGYGLLDISSALVQYINSDANGTGNK